MAHLIYIRLHFITTPVNTFNSLHYESSFSQLHFWIKCYAAFHCLTTLRQCNVKKLDCNRPVTKLRITDLFLSGYQL